MLPMWVLGLTPNAETNASRTQFNALRRFCKRSPPDEAFKARQVFPGTFSWFATYVKISFKLPPMFVTEKTMTTAISAAISPYSMAVTPSSSRTNFFADCMNRSMLSSMLAPPTYRADQDRQWGRPPYPVTKTCGRGERVYLPPVGLGIRRTI